MDENAIVIHLLRAHYNKDAETVERKTGWLDLTFAVTTISGEKLIFKIFKDPLASSKEQIEAEIELIEFLKQHGFPVPTILPTNRGEKYGSSQATSDADVEYFRLQTFVEGKLVDRSYSTRLCKELGSFAGEIDLALESSFENDFFKLSNGGPGGEPLISHGHFNTIEMIQLLQDEKQTQLAKLYLEKYDEKVRQQNLPKQIVHCDMHGRNLFADEKLENIIGLIDFSDACYTIRIMEPTVCIVGILLSNDDFSTKIDYISHFLQAYVEKIQLNDKEMQALPVSSIFKSLIILICI